MGSPSRRNGTESGNSRVALNQMLGQIEDALDERAASEDRLRRFVADASHELRTPVTTIRGYAELYRPAGSPMHDALDDAMRRTEQEAMRMGRLVEDMWCSPSSTRSARSRCCRSISASSSPTPARRRAAWPGRSITVDVGEEPAMVNGDEDRLRQVIANVVGNALVHTEPDVAVTLRVAREGDGRSRSTSRTRSRACPARWPNGRRSASTAPTRHVHDTGAAAGSVCRSSMLPSRRTVAPSRSTASPIAGPRCASRFRRATDGTDNVTPSVTEAIGKAVDRRKDERWR